MKIGIKPTVDVVFKTIFGNEKHADVTLSFLNAILEKAGRNAARSVAVLNPLRLGQFAGDRDAILDIRAVDELDREFQLEVQVRSSKELPRRMLHNWASCYLSSLAKGEKYGNLRPVISIWILECGFLGDGVWFHQFLPVDRDSGLCLCEDQTIVTIELPSWAKGRSGLGRDDIASELDRWLYFLVRGEELDPDDPEDLPDRESIREALEIMAVFTKADEARDLYRRRMDFRRQQLDFEHEAREARENGHAEGRAEGRAEGELQARRAIALNLRRRGLDAATIAEATGLSLEELEAL